MNWMTQIQLIDLDANQRIEVTCKECGHSRYENPYMLIKKYGLDFSYMDEVTSLLICNNRTCKGAVRLQLSTQDETEGFVGGLT